MGAWGAGLYSDDTTCEVRHEFKSNLERGLTHAEAERAILDRYADILGDHQIDCLVYFALADTTWKFGCLSDAVKQHTVDLLACDGDLKYWEEASPTDVRARARTLATLSTRLATPQPPLKKVKIKEPKPPRKQILAPIGTVFGLPLPDGNMAALKFVGLCDVGNWADGVFRLLSWKGSCIPSAAQLEPLSSQPTLVSGHHEFSILMDRRKKPSTYLVETGVVLEPGVPIDKSRWVAIGIDILPTTIQESLIGLSGPT